jgi:hypothetical protein
MINKPELEQYIKINKILQTYIKNGIEVGDRWSKGIEHHPKSLKLMQHLIELDFAFNSDYFCFKMGGDGDSGEILMYLMDMFFELEDKEFWEKIGPTDIDLERLNDILGGSK